jgi:multidrug resistance protein, MATE family
MSSGPVFETSSLLRRYSSNTDRPFPPVRALSDERNSVSNGYGAIVDEEDEEYFKHAEEEDTTWQTEVKFLARNSPSVIVTYLLQYSFNMVTVFVAGRLGTDELAAASLASMTVGILGLTIYEGLATCLDTLTAQAYGNGKKELVGLHVQRMCALMCIVTIPIGIVWLASPYFLPHLVPEKDIARLAGSFIQIYLIGGPGWGLFEAGKRFLQAQGNFHGSLVVLLVCAPANIFLNWLLPFQLGLGFRGAALAVAISNTLQPIVLVLYIAFIAPSTLECWPGLQWKRLGQNWGPMLKLALPGVLMTATEWLAFDILTFASSYLSAKHLAAQSVVTTVAAAIFHIPFPVSIVASTRFGNWIGYGALRAARRTWRTHYWVFICIGLFDLLVVTLLRHVIAVTFTPDKEVRSIIVDTLPIVASAQLFDAMLVISNGLLRGLGRQKIGGWVNLGVYYAFALPLSFTLTFGPPKLGLQGLWVGPSTGLGLGALSLFTYMKFADWEKAVEDARAREE